jgi:lipid II:glycine glycyltransferase (peptidoglycan interpeptide bridge formation enzyme)
MHKWLVGVPDSSWDKDLFGAGGHFLQSSHWAAFNNALDKRVFYGRGSDWFCLAILEQTRTGRRLYCPYGPLARDKKSFTAALEALRQLARAQSALFVRMEPIAPVKHLGDFKLKRALKDIQPPQTLLQDLHKSHEELLADLTPTNRNLFNTAAKKGLSFRVTSDPSEMRIFLDMIRDVAARTGITQHTDRYYRTMAKVLLARKAAALYIGEHNGSPVAAAFVFDSPTTRYYAHAGNLLSARKLHAGSPLLTTMILDAKKNGQFRFDYGGVAPKDQPNHRWAGFTKFKLSFGGTYHQYLGTWEMPTHPLYRLYRGVYQAHKLLK